MIRKALLILVLAEAPLVVSAQTAQETFPTRAIGASIESLQQLLVTYWDWRLANFPELATQVGRTEFNDRWRDWSKAARLRARAGRQEFLQHLLYMGQGNLTVADRLSTHLLEYELRSALDGEPYQLLVQRVSQMNGAHNQVFTVIDQMPARTMKDYENIIARLRALPRYVDQTIALIREQLDAGLAQPAVVVDLSLEQIAAQSRAPASASPLLSAFRRFPDDLPASDRQRLLAQGVAAYEQQFVPSWRKLESFLRGTYRRRARPQIGLTSIKDGATAYQQLVRTYTTTKMTPGQIHELGLQEVARIDKEMERIARDAGFTGPATAFEAQLKSRPEQRYANREEMLTAARDILKRIEPEMPRLFKRMPRASVGVRAIAPDREASTASNYVAGTPDGARQAWFNMNTYHPNEQSKYVTESLVIHETMPGHHLQVGLARELEGMPDFRRVFTATAFSEGWALYA